MTPRAPALDLDDFTVDQRLTLLAFDDRFGPVPERLSPTDERNARVLAHFGLVDEVERRLTERGVRLLDEGEVGSE